MLERLLDDTQRKLMHEIDDEMLIEVDPSLSKDDGVDTLVRESGPAKELKFVAYAIWYQCSWLQDAFNRRGFDFQSANVYGVACGIYFCSCR